MTTTRRTRAHRVACLVVATAMLSAAAGCSSSASRGATGDDGAAASTDGFPVTVDVCGQDVTFTEPPTRAVTNDINPFIDMAALDLEGAMVGAFGLSAFGPDGTTPVPTQYAAAYAEVDAVSPDSVEVEPLVGLEPDFLFAGWNYGLQVGTTKTPDELATFGIKTYALRESCAHVEDTKQQVTLDDTYTDLRNIGRIFGVADRAEEVVGAMRRRIAAVGAAVADEPRRTVFVYDGGTDAPFTAPGLAMPTALIDAAGGVNVFADLEETWSAVSWEQVVAADPDCILVNDYGTTTYDDKVDFLTTSPAARDLRAVTEGCFIRSTYGALTPSADNADAVEDIAEGLHPEAF